MVRYIVLASALLAACSPFSGEQGPAGPSATARVVSGDRAMYLTDSFNGSGLVAVDPLTLKDTSSRPLLPIQWSSTNNSFTVASLDGSAIAVMNYNYGRSATADGLDISVYDARSGTLRARLHPEVPVIVDGLSLDGSRIYARDWPPAQLGAARLVLDAMTGKVLEREPAISWDGDLVTYARDEHGRRLYAMVVPTDTSATAPRPVELAAWDLRMGAQLWRTAVPGLSAGRWLTGRSVDGRPVHASFTPGLALSADGRRLAVVKPGGCCVPTGRLWLLDASSGGVTLERTYESARSFIERLFVGPVAEAKTWDEAVNVSAAFFPGGRILHVWSRSIRVDEQGEPAQQYLGMAAVRLADASVSGSDIKMERGWYEDRIDWVRPSPDGRWLYVFLERTGEFADPKGYVLRRVDPVSLRVLTERRFDGFRQAFFLIAP